MYKISTYITPRFMEHLQQRIFGEDYIRAVVQVECCPDVYASEMRTPDQRLNEKFGAWATGDGDPGHINLFSRP
jgi:hypothetical protein